MTLPLAGIFWLGQRPRAQKPASKKRRRIIATFTLFFSVLVCVSCGSGLQGKGGGSGSPGTPTGTYNITVTTTSGTVTHSTPVGLTVTP